MSREQMHSVSLRKMTIGDVPRAAEMSRGFGWSHRPEDWASFMEIGEGIVAEANGEVVGTVMACRHGHKLATLGMMIIAEGVQGMGLGRRLMEAMIADLKGSAIVLQATENGAPFYEKLGFRNVGMLHQHQGIASDVPIPTLSANEAFVDLSPADIDIERLYSSATGGEKRAIVGKLLAEERSIALTLNGVRRGFAMVRRFGKGWYIAPVIASDLGTAKKLVGFWLRETRGEFTRIDVPGGTGLSEWVGRLGLHDVDAAQTMALGRLPETHHDFTVFAVTAQALG